MHIKTHPGEILLEEFLKPNGITPHALSMALNVPASRIAEITRAKRRVSADTAARLTRFFGTTAQFWLNLQDAYDLSVIETKLGEKIERIVPLAQINVAV